MMKRTLLASLLGLATCNTAFGDGSIFFSNYTSTAYNQVVYANNTALGALANQPVSSTTFELQLFWTLGNVTSDSLQSFYSTANAGVTTFIDSGINYLGGGFYFCQTRQILTGWTPGQVVTFGVEGWETGGALGGSTFAASGLSGRSSLWVESQGTSVGANGIQLWGPPPYVFPTQSFNNGPPAMTIDLVPEPSIFALFGIGAAALALIRRENRNS